MNRFVCNFPAPRNVCETTWKVSSLLQDNLYNWDQFNRQQEKEKESFIEIYLTSFVYD